MYLDDTHEGREAFSKVKRLLRKAEARTREALVEAMGKAFSAVTVQGAHDFFAHNAATDYRFNHSDQRCSRGHIP
jgi:hypothetical protein